MVSEFSSCSLVSVLHWGMYIDCIGAKCSVLASAMEVPGCVDRDSSFWFKVDNSLREVWSHSRSWLWRLTISPRVDIASLYASSER